MVLSIPPDVFYVIVSFSSDVRNLALNREIYGIVKKVYGERMENVNILPIEKLVEKYSNKLYWKDYQEQ